MQPVFYYDLGDPECYLAAERVMSELPVVPEWEPVWGPGLRAAAGDPEAGRRSQPPGRHFAQARERETFEARAAALGLQPIRWPQRVPETREAMLAATYAKQIGRAVAFSLAAFRQAYAAGRDLGERDTALIAGAACEMHPSALVKALTLRSVSDALELANLRARDAGVRGLPAIQAGRTVFEGPEAVGAAAAALAAEATR